MPYHGLTFNSRDLPRPHPAPILTPQNSLLWMLALRQDKLPSFRLQVVFLGKPSWFLRCWLPRIFCVLLVAVPLLLLVHAEPRYCVAYAKHGLIIMCNAFSSFSLLFIQAVRRKWHVYLAHIFTGKRQQLRFFLFCSLTSRILAAFRASCCPTTGTSVGGVYNTRSNLGSDPRHSLWERGAHGVHIAIVFF